MEFENSEKTSSKTVHWYHKKWVRVLAGALTVIMIFSAIGYSIMRSQVRSLYENISKSEDALKEISQINAGNRDMPNNIDQINNYASLAELIDKGDYIAAIDKTNEALKSNQSKAVKSELTEILCELYYNAGMYQEAVDTATAYTEDKVLTSALYYVRGLSYLQLSNYPEAVSDLEQVKELGEEDEASIVLQLALATYANNDYEAAAKYSEEYLRLNDPNKISSNIKKGVDENRNLCKYVAALSLMHQDEYERSIVYFDELLEVTKDSELYYYRGIDNMAMEDYEAAIDDFEKAMDLGKKDTDIYYDLGICRVSCGKLDEGIDNLKKVISNNDKPELSTASANILTAIAQGKSNE
jgi:tetratricopeptide (TPR) repeat protein